MGDQPTPRRRRTEPLRAPARPGPPPPTARQRAGLVAGAGLGVGVAVAGLVYAVIAIPLYLLARVDADGLDRPFIRTAFFAIALPAGAVAGVVVGVLVARWLARGGRLPTDRTSMFDTGPGVPPTS